MIDAEAMQKGRIQVVHVTRFVDDVVAEVVRLAIDSAAFDAAAGHPHAEAARMMVAAVVCRGERALGIDRAAKLAAPDDERVVQHPALLQVLQQGRHRAGPCRGIDAAFRWAGCRAGPSRDAGSARRARRVRPCAGPAARWRQTFRVSSLPGRTCRASPWFAGNSTSSGTLLCIRNAISYWAMRVWVSGSPKRSNVGDSVLPERPASRADGWQKRRAGCRDTSTGSPTLARRTPVTSTAEIRCSTSVEETPGPPALMTSAASGPRRRAGFALAAEAVCEP